MGQIESDEQIHRAGMGWLFGAGLFAVALSFTLYTFDEMLTNSPRERVLRDNLFELRSAQAALRGRVTDSRQSTTQHALYGSPLRESASGSDTVSPIAVSPIAVSPIAVSPNAGTVDRAKE